VSRHVEDGIGRDRFRHEKEVRIGGWQKVMWQYVCEGIVRVAHSKVLFRTSKDGFVFVSFKTSHICQVGLPDLFQWVAAISIVGAGDECKTDFNNLEHIASKVIVSSGNAAQTGEESRGLRSFSCAILSWEALMRVDNTDIIPGPPWWGG
jgi:hypothetical protein